MTASDPDNLFRSESCRGADYAEEVAARSSYSDREEIFAISGDAGYAGRTQGRIETEKDR